MHVGERFNLPQAGLTNVPLHEAFSWAYHHFILEDGLRLPQPFTSVRTILSSTYAPFSSKIELLETFYEPTA